MYNNLSQTEVRKSNDYYMNTGIQKTEIKKNPKSPFGILSLLLFIAGIVVSLFINQIYIGIGIEVVSFIFAIIHKVIKKKGIPWIILSLLGLILSIVVIILPMISPNIYDLNDNTPIAIQIVNNLFGKEPEVPVETEPETELETEPEETTERFDKTANYVSNTTWQVLEDDSCFYFLESGNYYWCKEKDNFDDNYYYGTYTIYQGEEAVAKMQELEYGYVLESEGVIFTEPEIEAEIIEETVGDMSNVTESTEVLSEEETTEAETTVASQRTKDIDVSQIYFIEMTNDLCYMDGEDITIEYKESKPVRHYCMIVDDVYSAKGCDIEKFNEEGFLLMSRIADSDLSLILEPSSDGEAETETTLEGETTEVLPDETTVSETTAASQGIQGTTTTVEDSSFSDPIN